MDDNWLAKIAKNGKHLGGFQNVGAKVGHRHRRKIGALDKI